MRALSIRLADNAYLLLILTMVFWGGNAVAGKMVSAYIPPITLTAIRWILTAALFYLFARPHLRASLPILKQNKSLMLFYGIIGYSFYNFSLYGALSLTSAINVTIEQAGMPMIILLGMMIFFKEKVSPLQIFAVFMSILGIIITATRGNPVDLLTLDVNKGDAIMLIGVCLYAAYSITLKKRPIIPWQVFMFSVTFIAALISIPFALIDISYNRPPVFNQQSLLLLAYIVIFPSFLSQSFYVRAVELIGASRSGLFINLVPVFGALFAVIIIDESFELYHLIGLLLVIGGILLSEYVTRVKKQEMTHKKDLSNL